MLTMRTVIVTETARFFPADWTAKWKRCLHQICIPALYLRNGTRITQIGRLVCPGWIILRRLMGLCTSRFLHFSCFCLIPEAHKWRWEESNAEDVLIEVVVPNFIYATGPESRKLDNWFVLADPICGGWCAANKQFFPQFSAFFA
jgi:hypothetical protein